MPVEPLTAEERDAFIAQYRRVGETITAQMLALRGVKRFSSLSRVDRLEMLEAMRKVRK